MTDAMTHRGPNDRGTSSAPGVALGVRRLSIVDVEGGHQPFANEDGTIWAVQNGELYNHDALRDDSAPRRATVPRAAATPRSSRISTSETAPRSPSTCAACSALAVWDGDRRRARARARPARHQAALLRRRRRPARLRLRAQEPARQRSRRGRARLRGDRRVPDARVRRRRRARRSRRSRSSRPGTALVVEDGRRARSSATGRYPEPPRTPDGDARRTSAKACSRSSTRRCACG